MRCNGIAIQQKRLISQSDADREIEQMAFFFFKCTRDKRSLPPLSVKGIPPISFSECFLLEISIIFTDFSAVQLVPTTLTRTLIRLLPFVIPSANYRFPSYLSMPADKVIWLRRRFIARYYFRKSQDPARDCEMNGRVCPSDMRGRLLPFRSVTSGSSLSISFG